MEHITWGLNAVIFGPEGFLTAESLSFEKKMTPKWTDYPLDT